MTDFWGPVAFRFAVVGFLAVFSGFVFGERAGLLVAIAGLLVLVVLHIYYLMRVARWLKQRTQDEETGQRTEDLPEGFGAWQTIFTELRRARRRDDKRSAEVEEALDRFIEATNALPDGIIILDRADRIEWANPSACSHFGLNLDRDQGFLVANLIRQPAFTEYLVRADFSEPLQLERSPMTLAVQLLPFQQTRRMVLSRDITPLMRVERMRRDFIANVSHELRTPLTVVGGFVEQMLDAPEMDDAHRKRFLDLMLNQSQRMQRLIEDLLTLSRLESEGVPSMEEKFAALPLFESLVEEARALSHGRHNITLDATPAMLAGHQDELSSAFGNLLSNAVRYTPQGGNVHAAFHVSADGMAFTVTDTGPGIAPEHIPRLTERFYRVDKSRSRETGGTGLGLAIVKHILVRHGGRLEIESEVGRGSKFRAVLPPARVSATR